MHGRAGEPIVGGMSSNDRDRHQRADAPEGALSPGSTATAAPTGRQAWRAEYGVEPPVVPRSPADPEALVRGQRVTQASDMEPGPGDTTEDAAVEASAPAVQPAGPAHADADLEPADAAPNDTTVFNEKEEQ